MFSTQSEIVVPFWTKDFPELICTGTFSKNSLGEVVYELDFQNLLLKTTDRVIAKEHEEIHQPLPYAPYFVHKETIEG